MSITFRIATASDDQPGPVATINARQLAAFRLWSLGGYKPHLEVDPDGE